MTEINLFNSRWKVIKLLAWSTLFVLIGIWRLSIINPDSNDNILGWMCIIVFGITIPFELYYLLDRRPQIVINEIGIRIRSSKQDLIRWENIRNAISNNISRQKIITLVLDGSIKIKKLQNRWGKRIPNADAAQKINLPLTLVKVNQEKLVGLLNKMIESDKDGKRKILYSFISQDDNKKRQQ